MLFFVLVGGVLTLFFVFFCFLFFDCWAEVFVNFSHFLGSR